MTTQSKKVLFIKDDQNSDKKILVVEDERMMMDALRAELVENGFDILEADNGKEGLELALQEHPDLILIDILLPKMDGMTMLKQIRNADPWGAEVPAIFLTNLSPSSDQFLQAISEMKPVYYLIKSNTSLNDLTEKIKEVFEKK